MNPEIESSVLSPCHIIFSCPIFCPLGCFQAFLLLLSATSYQRLIMFQYFSSERNAQVRHIPVDPISLMGGSQNMIRIVFSLRILIS